MDLKSARARLHAMADLQRTGLSPCLMTSEIHRDWRQFPVQIPAGWIALVEDMLGRLLALPERARPSFHFIRWDSGTLDLSWFDGTFQADAVCVAAIAAASHTCELCGKRARHQRVPGGEHTLCRSHAQLARDGKLKQAVLEDLLKSGQPYRRRRVLVSFVFGGRTESGLTAGMLTRTGEHGFEMDALYFPAAWLQETARHADLFAIHAFRLTHVIDHSIFAWVRQRRDFVISEALPLLQEALLRRGQVRDALDVLVNDIASPDPEIRVPTFQAAARLLDELDGE